MNRENTSFYRALFHSTSRKIIHRFVFLLLALVIGVVACEEEPSPPEPAQQAKIILRFDHVIDNFPIQFDTLMYQNAAGNPYLINEIQYFISDLKLYHTDRGEYLVDGWKDIHYVDTDLESTWTWEVFDDIQPGVYDSVAFTFGIAEEKNQSFMFVNAPEKDMFWPEYLGGGYHYMKLNGKWLPDGQSVQTLPFDFHLGIGQIYFSYPDSISYFVHNDFRVSLPGSGFVASPGASNVLKITMHIENWFQQPHVYNHDVYGGYIMQSQEAMQMVKDNGMNVFTFEVYDYSETE